MLGFYARQRFDYNVVQALRNKFINTKLSNFEKVLGSRQNGSSQATTEIRNCEGAKLDLEKRAAEIRTQMIFLSKHQGKQAATLCANYKERVTTKQQIVVLQRLHDEYKVHKLKLKKDFDEMDFSSPTGCAEALIFLEDYCKRNKVNPQTESRFQV